MTWWFIILGFSALVVVCVAIALILRVKRHLSAERALREDPDAADRDRAGHS